MRARWPRSLANIAKKVRANMFAMHKNFVVRGGGIEGRERKRGVIEHGNTLAFSHFSIP